MRVPPPDVTSKWPRPNYVDPPTRSPEAAVGASICLALAMVCLTLRLYVRLSMLRKPWWDDWLMLAGAIVGVGFTTTAYLETLRYGWNRHVWDVPFTVLEDSRKVSIAGQTLFVVASGLIKWAILTSYLRIAPLGSLFRKLTWGTIALVISLLVAFVIVLWTECKPVSSYWNLFLTNKDCIEEAVPMMAQMVTSVFTDIVVYLLPMPTFAKLHLPITQRLILMFLVGIGLIVVVAGCMRTYWDFYSTDKTYDVTWAGQNTWMWPAVEINLGIVCGCVPTLRPLLKPAAGLLSTARQRLRYGSRDSESERKPSVESDQQHVQPTPSDIERQVGAMLGRGVLEDLKDDSFSDEKEVPSTPSTGRRPS